MFNFHHKSSESTVLLFISFVKYPDNAAIFVPNPPEKDLPAACPYCYKMGTTVTIGDSVTFQQRGISKTVLNEIPSVPISDYENTFSFPSEETSLDVGASLSSPNGRSTMPVQPYSRFSPPLNWTTQ